MYGAHHGLPTEQIPILPSSRCHVSLSSYLWSKAVRSAKGVALGKLQTWFFEVCLFQYELRSAYHV